MKRNKFEKITLLLLACVGFGITFAEFTSLIEHVPWLKEKVNSIVLVSISALIIYVLSDSDVKSKELKQLEDGIHESKTQIIYSLSGIEAKLFVNSDEAFRYLTEAVNSASSSIDQVAISPTPEVHSDILSSYLNSITDVARIGSIRYRFVFGENYDERSARVRAWASDVHNRRFFAKSYNKSKSSSVPILNFVIFDSEVVFMRYPNTPGQKEIYIAARHNDIKDLFEAYYERIWEMASES